MSDLRTRATDDLIAERDRAADAYYGGDGSPLTDDAFDSLTAELASRGVAEQVGHGAPGGKIAHGRRMLSLKKVHDVADLEALLAAHPDAACTIEPKWDGLAASVRYGVDGHLERALTRGDGERGEDITPAIRAVFSRLGLPLKLDGPGEVRGEIVMTRSTFSAVNELLAATDDETFSNPRNAASGLIARVARNIGKPAKAEVLEAAVLEAGGSLTFLAYDGDGSCQLAEVGISNVVNSDGNAGVRYHSCLGSAPFPQYLLSGVGLRSVGSQIDESVNWLANHAGELDVETDGVVVKLSDPALRAELGESSTAPRWALAYKFPNRPKQTVLRAVEWSETRTGRVVPTAVFDTVELSGAMVSRATLNNVSFLEELDVWIGDTIEVTRANEVIPNVVRRIGEHAADAAPADIPTAYRREGRDLVHDSGRDPVKDISFAASALDILGLGEDVARRLVTGNPQIDSFPALIEACRENGLAPFERGTQKLVDKLTSEVLAKTNGPQDPAKWIKAAGIPGIGYRAGKKIAVECVRRGAKYGVESPFKELTEMLKKPESLLNIEGFGPASVQAVIDAQDRFQLWHVAMLGNESAVNWRPYREQMLAESGRANNSKEPPLPLSGKRVLVTGTFPSLSRQQAEERIEELGGTVASSVSKNLDLLVAGDKAGSKLAKAEALGVEVMVAAEFEELGR